MSKQFWGIIIVVVLIFVGFFALSGNKNSGSKSSSTGTLTNHVEGLGKSGVTLVEYGDYECPYCQAAAPIVKQVQSEFNTDIYFQFRNFPLVSIHQNAFAGARAAEAAALQNKFWEMHDALYETSNWQVWSTASNPNTYFNTYAQQLGLNVTQFKTDFLSDKVNNLIRADMAEGNKLGIEGTPTFYLDGKQIDNPGSVAGFESIIKAEIAKKNPSYIITATPAATPAAN